MMDGRSQTERIIVIGGGVIGGFCALEFAQAGMKVTILEQNKFGAGCSYANCGYVSPSHLLPLAQPGVVSKTLRELLKWNSPFSISPGFSVQSIHWFWKFMRSCNRRQMMASAEGLHALLQSSKVLYQQYVQQGFLDCQWREKGILFVFEKQRDFDKFSQIERITREHFGVAAHPLTARELLEREPSIRPVIAGAWHFEGDCHLSPNHLLQSLRQRLEELDVDIVEEATVDDIVKESERVQGVSTEKGVFKGNQYVIATGAWASLLQGKLGCKIAIQPGKGYSVTLPCPNKSPQTPIIFEDTHVAVTPLGDRLRIGSTMEFAGFDKTIRQKRISILRDSARKYLQLEWQESEEELWSGLRPMTWDSKPLICKLPRLENAWICAGHGMLGISTAPASARLLREMVLGEQTHLAADHFSMANR